MTSSTFPPLVVDSVGFAGTHTLSHILQAIPDSAVTHGLQRFTPVVPDDGPPQSPAAFAAAMRQAASDGRRAVAVHCLFNPLEMKPICDRAGVGYRLLVRRPEDQVESCYAWAAKKVLRGDDTTFVAALQSSFDLLRQGGIALTLPNLTYAYALLHVARFNAAGLATRAQVVRMEELLNDEAAFRATFELPEAVPLPHFAGAEVRRVSHRGDPALAELGAPDRAAIQALLTVTVPPGPSRTLAQMATALGY